MPKCLCSCTFITGNSLKRMTVWPIFTFFLEKINSRACFLGSGLKDILQFCAHSLLRSRSWFISIAAALEFLTIAKKDVFMIGFDRI